MAKSRRRVLWAVVLLPCVAGFLLSCRAGDATGLELEIVNGSERAVTFAIDRGPQAGTSSVEACEQVGFALQPDVRVTVEVRSATDTVTFTATPAGPSGGAPERWIVVGEDGAIHADAPARSPGTSACPPR